MTKKIISFLVSTLLIVSLVGCGSSSSAKSDLVPLEEVNIDFEVATVDNGTLKFDYPTENWEEGTSLTEGKILYAKGEDFEEGTNINISPSVDVKGMKLEEYSKQLPEQLESASPGTKCTLSEVRTLGDREVAYAEFLTKITDEVIDLLIEQGQFTEEIIEQIGGREALLQQPEVKQIQMAIEQDGKICNITGSYQEDSEREAVLKAMTTMVQTATVK